MSTARAAGTVLVLGLALATPASALRFGQRYDLPVPLWLWVAGAAAAVARSFVVSGIFAEVPAGLHRYPTPESVGARFARYTAVIAIVTGHVVAVVVAHAIALRQFGSRRRRALRSQYAMLVLMIGYTMASLWIVAQPIVESRAG